MGTYEPGAHYDRVHAAWRLIMGEEFHYGYFERPDVPLERATQALTDCMLDRARIEIGDRVLDVGCGTGRQACDLAHRFRAAVLGITTSAQGVMAAAKLAAERGLPEARFAQRDGSATEFADGGFDVVWVLESSHLMRDRTALLLECARLLAPGGRLVLCDIVRKREVSFDEVRARRSDFATLRAAFGDAHMEPLNLYTGTLSAVGLEVTHSADISEPTLPTFAAWRANVDAHRDALRGLLGDDGVGAFVDATHILEGFWQDQTLGYGILAATKAT